MSKFAKISIGIGFSLLVIAIAGILFSRHLVTKSFPITDGVLIVEGLHASVDVYRDEYGVPHINARDEHDLMFATGYVHAQDRLWQMDLMRRSGEGRLSELLGSSTTEIDALFRTIDLRGVAEKMKRQMHPQSLQILEDYRDGVNAFIVTHKGSYPVEFDMLNYEPELWRVEHSLLIARLIAWDLNLAWWTDLTYGEIAAKVPSEKMQEIFPTFPDSIPVTVPSALTKKALSSIRDMLNVGRSYRDLFGLGSLEAGSNGWVVDSSKSLSGKPLLANDPHLAMPAPSRWYEVHLSAPGWNVAGVSVPGAPVIIIGHNDHHAWGLTNAMLDDADFYVERIDSTNPSYYLFQKSSQRFDERNEVIHIRGGDSLTLNVRSTRHGPIINDVHPMHHHQDSASHQYPIALRWTGLDVSDEIHGFSLMNRATTIGEFEEGLKEIEVPGQSVVYADTNGNIAYWTTGRVPIRGKGNPMLPMPGWTGDAEWNGFIPFDRLPKRINPPEGMIVCANQKIADNTFPYYLST
ncbi:MAG: penicillin acylase family protein, partial [Ignavibacteria bacterium]|nr:penicillin acylase family protein [Ignavibacteria bacterium]